MTNPPDHPSDPTGLQVPLGEIADVETLAEYVQAARRLGAFVSQEPLDGPVFSVKTLSTSGMHHVAEIVRLEGPHERQEAQGTPSEEESALLRSVVRGVLDLAGHESGTARAEVVLLPQGPRFRALWLENRD